MQNEKGIHYSVNLHQTSNYVKLSSWLSNFEIFLSKLFCLFVIGFLRRVTLFTCGLSKCDLKAWEESISPYSNKFL